MQRLNIPLDRHKRTTRHKRRVVWLLIFGYVLAALVTWFFSSLWLERDTVSVAAPDTTSAIIRLTATKKHAPLYLRYLGNTPLISYKSITIKDLLPYIHGEFAMFTMSDGSKAVAMRSTESKMPYELFDYLGIVVSEVSPNVFLLSHKPLPVSSVTPNKKWHLPTINPFTKRLGSIILHDGNEKTHGVVSLNGKLLSISIQGMEVSSNLPEKLPPDVFAAVSTPALPNTSLLSLSGEMDAFISPINTLNTTDITSTVLSSPGFILLSKDENGAGFLISTTKNLFQEGDQKRLLTTFAALKNPRQEDWTLPDDSSVVELVSDPSSVSVEERTVFGTPVLHVAASEFDEMFTAISGDRAVVTNREKLLKFWLNPADSEKTQVGCSANHAIINLEAMQKMSSQGVINYQTSFLSMLSSSIRSAAVISSGKTTTLSFCNG